MNKNKIFGLVAVLVIAAMVAVNVNINSQEKGLSDIYLANVEALANEGTGSGNACFKTVTFNKDRPESEAGDYKYCGKECKTKKAHSASNEISESSCM